MATNLTGIGGERTPEMPRISLTRIEELLLSASREFPARDTPS